jgi:hypothetical protein
MLQIRAIDRPNRKYLKSGFQPIIEFYLSWKEILVKRGQASVVLLFIKARD